MAKYRLTPTYRVRWLSHSVCWYLMARLYGRRPFIYPDPLLNGTRRKRGLGEGKAVRDRTHTRSTDTCTARKRVHQPPRHDNPRTSARESHTRSLEISRSPDCLITRFTKKISYFDRPRPQRPFSPIDCSLGNLFIIIFFFVKRGGDKVEAAGGRNIAGHDEES